MPLNFRFPDNKLRPNVESTSLAKKIDNRQKIDAKSSDNLKLLENIFQTTTKSRNIVFRPVQTQNLNSMIGFLDFENVSLKKKLMQQNNKNYIGNSFFVNFKYLVKKLF